MGKWLPRDPRRLFPVFQMIDKMRSSFLLAGARGNEYVQSRLFPRRVSERVQVPKGAERPRHHTDRIPGGIYVCEYIPKLNRVKFLMKMFRIKKVTEVIRRIS